MRVPLTWMREYCDPGWEPERLAERLAMTGTEVERVTRFGVPSGDGFVVGEVKEVAPHPDADRLSVCKVDTGDRKPRTIVCGAPNVAAGQLVPVALPGALLAFGEELKRAKLRGVESDGMILSEAELQIGEDSAGIAVLAQANSQVSPGTALAEVIPISEPVLELEITPNRPDCLAVYGVAREAHAVSGEPLGEPPWEEDAEATGDGDLLDYAAVEVRVPELCPRFTARVFTDVEVGPSPLWLRARLSAAGQRSINNVVDITNYAMLAIGQPMHAYDLDRVPDGRLVIDAAKGGEKLTTLDGVERSFERGEVLIYDRNGPSGIAGIMGGASSEVSEQTTRVLLEVANWNGVSTLQTSNRLQLRSEASSRFEKQLHPELALYGQRLASRLMVELCGAKLVPGTIDVTGEIPVAPVIELHAERVEALVGMAIPAERCEEDLERLGFSVDRQDQTLGVAVPPERHYDVSREADLIEEVARLHDLDKNLPTTLPAAGNRAGRLSREQRLLRLAEDTLRDLGCDEIVAWSFHDPGLAERLRLPESDPRRPAVHVSNPLSVDQSVMRTTLLGGLLDAARLNLSRGAEQVRLFESGRVYLREGTGAQEFLGDRPAPAVEPHRLGCLLCGPDPRAWRDGGREPDFFYAKGLLEALAASLGAECAVERSGDPEPFLNPSRAAAIVLDGERAGWIGELHPLAARAWDLETAVGFELDALPLLAAATAREEEYEDLTTYPAALQDIAVTLPAEVSAAELRATVLEAGGELLRSAKVFDRYEGEQVGEGKVSVALRLSFRAPDRTLTDEDVAERRASIAAAIERIGGSLRE